MIPGMSTSTFTWVHVVLSLIGIVSGAVVLFGMLGAMRLGGWTPLFLGATVLTSVTGFFFHSAAIGPPHVVGVISLAVLAVAIVAAHVYERAKSWHWIYIVGAVAALYLNAFIGVVQAFQKLPFLNPLAPTQTEPPFLAAQLAVPVLFIALGIVSVKRFHPATKAPALRAT
jgi:hypothetical protein